MTIQQLLENLIKRRESIDAAISEIYKVQANTTIRRKSREILNTVRPVKQYRKTQQILKAAEKKVSNQLGRKYNGTHWMQRPENKAKMMANIRNMQKANKRAKK